MKTLSKADRQRRAWCLRHGAIVSQLQRQLTRRTPYRFAKVWCVSWLSKNGADIMTWADWGTKTRRQAIDKARHQETQELKH